MQVQYSFQFDEKQQYCNLHNKRQIEFICLKQGCEQTFFCNDCFRNGFHQDHQKKVFQIDEITDVIDEQQLIQNIFAFSEVEEEGKIIEEFNILKEQIYKCIDQVQKNILTKYQHSYERMKIKSDIINNLQEKLKKFCERKINQKEINEIINEIQEANKHSTLDIYLNKQQINSVSKNILDQLKNLEEYVIEGLNVDLPDIQLYNQVLKLQSDKSGLSLYGYNHSNCRYLYQNLKQQNNLHNFKLNLDYSQTYLINVNLYKNDKFVTHLQLANQNKIVSIKVDKLKTNKNDYNQGQQQPNNNNNNLVKVFCSKSFIPSLSVQQEINLRDEKNEFQITICLSRNLFIIHDINQDIYYKPIFDSSQSINQMREQGYFTFDSEQAIQKEIQNQFVKLMDISKIISYLQQ